MNIRQGVAELLCLIWSPWHVFHALLSSHYYTATGTSWRDLWYSGVLVVGS
jgi:hypothetical protein